MFRCTPGFSVTATNTHVSSQATVCLPGRHSLAAFDPAYLNFLHFRLLVELGCLSLRERAILFISIQLGPR